MRLTRRKMIKYFGSSGIALTAPQIFAARKTRSSIAQPPLILAVRIQGGWDPTMVFDPKIGSSTVSQESGAAETTAGSIPYVSHPDRPSIAEFFANHNADAVVINGVYCRAMDHESALIENHSIPLSASHFRGDGRRADPLAIYATRTDPGLSAPHINLGCTSTAGAYIPMSHQLTKGLIDRYSTGSFAMQSSFSSEADEAVRKYFNRRIATTLSTFPSLGLDSEKIDSLARNYSREHYFYEVIPEVISQIGSPSSTLLRYMKIALQLFAKGQTLAAAVGDDDQHGWDTHRSHYSNHSRKFESLFEDLNEALGFASQLGLSDRLILIVGSDVGRSPQLNSAAGKDHWSFSSALLYSRLIVGNQVIGGTDDFLRGQKVSAETGKIDQKDGIVLTMPHIYASIFKLLGMELEDTFIDQTYINALVPT